MLEAEPSAGIEEGERSVAGAVIGHDVFDRDVQARILGDGGLEEGHGNALALVGLDLGESDARASRRAVTFPSRRLP
jgi:hypothetical protein